MWQKHIFLLFLDVLIYLVKEECSRILHRIPTQSYTHMFRSSDERLERKKTIFFMCIIKNTHNAVVQDGPTTSATVGYEFLALILVLYTL